jgi:ureidoglycolate hydrolase
MKYKVLKTCQDKNTGETYAIGSVIELDEKRAAAAPPGYLEQYHEVKKNAGTGKKSAAHKD